MAEERVLVAYGTRSGVTREVAQAIAEGLSARGAAPDVRPAREVRNLTAYDAVVLGTPVHAGRTHGHARSFLTRNRQRLGEVPVAYFVVCATMQEDTPENRQRAEAFLGPWRERVPEVSPVDVGLFAGAFRCSKEAPLLLRLVLKAMASKPEEAAKQAPFPDLDAARAWGASLTDALLRA